MIGKINVAIVCDLGKTNSVRIEALLVMSV